MDLGYHHDSFHNSASSSHALEKPKVETLNAKFRQMNLSPEDELSRDDVVNFLRKNMPPREAYDSQFVDKLCETLGFKYQNKITVSDFINGFIGFELGMNDNQKITQEKVEKEQAVYDELDDKCREYQYENQNPDGLCDNSKITIEFINIEMSEEVQDIKNLYLFISYRDFKKEIKIKTNEYSPRLNETVELRPIRRSDPIQIALQSKDYNKRIENLGKYEFTLEDKKEQDKFKMKIELREITDRTKILATINANIQFYYSDYLFYDKKRKVSEKKLDSLKQMLGRINKILKQMNNVYEYNAPNVVEKPKSLRTKKKEIELPKEETAYDSKNQFIEPAVPYEQMQVKATTQKKLDYNKVINISSIILIGLSVIAALYNADFINGLLAVLLWCYCRGGFDIPLFNNLKVVGTLDIVAMIYNFIWLCLNCGKKSEVYEDNKLKGLCILVTIIMLVLEAIIAFFLFKNPEKENQTTF